MKVDNFVLLMISIITLIIISLVTECNRGRLKELEDKATREIKETFFGHLSPANSTAPGQWGYKITGITEGQYGGRSSQVVSTDMDASPQAKLPFKAVVGLPLRSCRRSAKLFKILLRLDSLFL